MKLALFMLFTACCANAALAANACDKPRDDFDGLYCLNKAYQDADAELNASYQQLVAKLDTIGRSVLRKSQLAWIEERNARCSKKEGEDFFVNLNCAAQTTAARNRFLQDRLRECAKSGCQTGKL